MFKISAAEIDHVTILQNETCKKQHYSVDTWELCNQEGHMSKFKGCGFYQKSLRNFKSKRWQWFNDYRKKQIKRIMSNTSLCMSLWARNFPNKKPDRYTSHNGNTFYEKIFHNIKMAISDGLQTLLIQQVEAQPLSINLMWSISSNKESENNKYKPIL